ncbi:GntR family transcriptional regulator [Paenibacillus solisilvae]|uniref:GntR family transcriptional regulator n=1 Tax=Paenibacillus solisilvae TaxID=2486751 RepID=A0ABW0VXD6_9BACL
MESWGGFLDYSSIFTEMNYVSVSEKVYEAIKGSILSGKLKVGEQLNERLIAKHMGTSVSPVKDALRKMEKEGLVVIVPRKGSFVAEGIMTSIEEIYMVRGALESVAAYLAAQKLNEEQAERLRTHFRLMEEATRKQDLLLTIDLNQKFHVMIRKIANNSYLMHQLDVIRSFELSTLQKQFLSEPEQLNLALVEHESILLAILDKDALLAEERTAKHIQRTVEYLRSKMNPQVRT